jgi:hypothetical protein
MEPIGSAETSVSDYRTSPNNPEDGRIRDFTLCRPIQTGCGSYPGDTGKTLSPEVKRPEGETTHPLPPTSKIKKTLPYYIFSACNLKYLMTR